MKIVSANGFQRALSKEICKSCRFAARPDKHWQLIAYPYNAKSAASGQKTGFLHMDLNLKHYQSEGLGKNMVQSSVSLMDENIKGCTVVS